MHYNNVDFLFVISITDFRKMATFQDYTSIFDATEWLDLIIADREKGDRISR